MKNFESENSIRINKRLVELSFCSRRLADELIKKGRVKINGRVAKIGEMVLSTDSIFVDDKKIENNTQKVLYAYYKPKGIVCTESKKEKCPRVCDEIRKKGIKFRVFNIGRLDKMSSGLLLLTNDGNFAKDMTKYGNIHEKEYEVILNKDINDDFVSKMEKGIYLKELDKTTLPCTVKIKSKKKFLITICQGLNRQIRRMCDALGYKVIDLKRIRIDKYKLGNMKIGEIKKLTFTLLIISLIFLNFNTTISSELNNEQLITSESGPGTQNNTFNLYDNGTSKNSYNNGSITISTMSAIPKDSPYVVVGRDGWFFFKNNDFLVNLGKSEVMIEAYFNRLLSKLLLVREMYVKDPKEFVFMICPEKNTIYKDYLPADQKEEAIEINRRIDQFIAYVRANSDIKIVYPKDDIEKISKYCETYYRQDSHWNTLAGYIAAHELIESINPNDKSIKPAWDYNLLADIKRTEGDLCYYNGNEVEYYLDGLTNRPLNADYIQVDEDNKKPFRIRARNPKDNRKLFFIRDSFIMNMMPLLGEYFQEESFLYILNSEYFSEDFLSGDTFVIQMVERNFQVIENILDKLISKDY